jgi:hypothetical protein
MASLLESIYKNINKNRGQIKHLLEQLSSSVQSEHDESTAKLMFEIEKVKDSKDAEQKILNLSIVYNDNFRKLTRKIDNLIVDKNIFHIRNDQLVAYHSNLLSEEEHSNFRQVFSKICNYDTKGNEEMKLYQDPRFCSYILAKTFKKTFNEVYDFLAVAADKDLNKRLGSPVTVAAIGGGPGNDGLAIAMFIRTRFIVSSTTPIHVTVYDLSSEAWKQCASDSINKAYSNLQIEVSWMPIDHTKLFEYGDLKADFISACWTLNEHKDFNEIFWNQLVKANPNSTYLVIEGELKNIDKLHGVLMAANFDDIYYEKYTNPRKFLAWRPNSATNIAEKQQIQ